MTVLGYAVIPSGIWCAKCWRDYRESMRNSPAGFDDDVSIEPIYSTQKPGPGSLTCIECGCIIVVAREMQPHECFCGNPKCNGQDCYWTEDCGNSKARCM